MSLRYAILGLLTFEPMSGYTLKTRFFDRSIRYFWPADQAQIYRSLQALEDDGAVTSETLENESRPNSKLYTISEKGEQELRDWLVDQFVAVLSVTAGRDAQTAALVQTMAEDV